MKKTVKNVNTFQLMLVVWLVFSSLYIMHDLWKNGISATYQLGYQAGAEKTITQVVATSQKCQPFNVFAGEAKADLINMACLQPAPSPETEASAVEETGA